MAEEELELSCNRTLKIKIQQMSRGFLAYCEKVYPELTTEAMTILLPFPASFSTLTAMKKVQGLVAGGIWHLSVIHPTKNKQALN